MILSSLQVEASRIKWCPSETLFVVIHGNVCDIFSPEVGGVIGTIDFGRKISDLTFIGDFLVLSGEEGKVNVTRTANLPSSYLSGAIEM